jgi:exopolyphosphatase/guanosine-5'-triphosphate,3'-diphosphate pyrophosphatase
MLLAKPTNRSFRVVTSFSRIVRLGEGLDSTGMLCEAAIARTVAALKVCAGMMRDHRVAASRGVATEACRRAGNGREFLTRVKAETGITLKPISSDEEARLTLAGCAPLLDPDYPFAFVFDIGGGSTELMWIAQSAGRAPRPIGIRSLPHGVVTLAERFGRDAVPETVYKHLIGLIDDHLADFDAEHGIDARVREGAVTMLGTSGTVTTLGGLYLNLPRYDRSRVDGLVMEVPAVLDLNRRLAAMDCAARARIPCIGPERADLVVMGCAILEAIVRRWPVARLRAADRGIREGLLLGMIARANGQGRPRRRRWR